MVPPSDATKVSPGRKDACSETPRFTVSGIIVETPEYEPSPIPLQLPSVHPADGSAITTNAWPASNQLLPTEVEPPAVAGIILVLALAAYLVSRRLHETSSGS